MQEAEVTNAGLGSNLTLDGFVEADASVMLGDKTFAAVGAAPGLYNQLALPLEQDKYIFSLGQTRKLYQHDMTLHHSAVKAFLVACAGLASPIEAATMLAEESRQPLPLGRVRPM